MSLHFRHHRICLYFCFMLWDLHTYTSHHVPLRSRAIRRLVFEGCYKRMWVFAPNKNVSWLGRPSSSGPLQASSMFSCAAENEANQSQMVEYFQAISVMFWCVEKSGNTQIPGHLPLGKLMKKCIGFWGSPMLRQNNRCAFGKVWASADPLLEKPSYDSYDHVLLRYTSVNMEVSINGDTLKLMVYKWKILSKLMIWGYPHLRKPSYEFRSWDMKHDDVS